MCSYNAIENNDKRIYDDILYVSFVLIRVTNTNFILHKDCSDFKTINNLCHVLSVEMSNRFT